jgi:hypothetical protein
MQRFVAAPFRKRAGRCGTATRSFLSELRPLARERSDLGLTQECALARLAGVELAARGLEGRKGRFQRVAMLRNRSQLLGTLLVWIPASRRVSRRTRFVSRKRFFEPIARDSGPGSGPSTSRKSSSVDHRHGRLVHHGRLTSMRGGPRTSRRDQTYWAASARGLDDFPGRPDELFVSFGAGCSNDLPTQSIVNKLSHPGVRAEPPELVLGDPPPSVTLTASPSTSHRLHPALRAPEGWARQLLEVVDQEIDERPRRSLRPAPGGK